MRRLIFLLCCLFLSVSAAHAQSSLFKNALKGTRPVGSWYQWENKKDSQVKMEKVQEYAQKNNILLGKCTTKEVGRFGDVAISAAVVEFIPKDEFPAYIMERMIDNSTPISAFNQKGTVYNYDPKDRFHLFQAIDDALWTGRVNGGKIDGEGVGAKQLGPTQYIAFKGKFKDGLPVGKVAFYTYQPKNEFEKYDGKYRREKTAEMGDAVSDGFLVVHYDRKYGFVDMTGNVVISPEYDEVSPYRDGVATGRLGQVVIEMDKKGNPLRLRGESTTDLDRLIRTKKDHPAVTNAIEATLKEQIQTFSYSELIRIKNEFPGMAESVTSRVKANIPGYAFSELVKVDKDFPSLADLSMERKKQLYADHCGLLAQAYQKALSAAQENRSYLDDRSFVSRFIRDYGETYQFDPDRQVPLAKEIDVYYDLCDAIAFNPNQEYCYLSSDPPQFRKSDAESDMDYLANAYRRCNDVPSAFQSFADFARPRIVDLGNTLTSNLNKQYYTLYNNALEKAKAAAIRKFESLKTYSDLKPYIKRVDEWKVVEHRDDSIFGGTGKLIRSEQTIVFDFNEGFSILVTHYWDSPGWTSSPKNNYSSNAYAGSYDTLDECLLKGYQKKMEPILRDRYKSPLFFLHTMPWY